LRVLRKGINKKLNPFFNSREFDCKCSSDRCHFTLLDDKIVSALMMARVDWGNPINITSGFRCQAHNFSISGHKASKHTIGMAVDVVLPNNKRITFLNILRKYFDVVVEYSDKNFAHCQLNLEEEE